MCAAISENVVNAHIPHNEPYNTQLPTAVSPCRKVFSPGVSQRKTSDVTSTQLSDIHTPSHRYLAYTRMSGKFDN